MALKDERLYSEILELLLSATLESQLWFRVLEKISILAGHHYAALLFYDKGNAQLFTDALLCEEKVFTAYRDVFLALDPAEKILNSAPVGQLYQDREVLGDKFIATSTYYNEFHRPNDMHYLTSVKLNAVNGYACFLSLMTASDAAYPQSSHFDLFKRLIPALIAASNLYARFEALRENLKYQSALLDNHIYPVWLVNGAGKVLYANRHAEHYQSQRRDSWATRHDTMNINTDSKKLKQAIRRATVNDQLPKAALCYTTGSTVMPVLVLPSSQMPGVASVIIPVPFLSGTPLIDLFGLTPSENTIVGLLIRGMTAEECALHLSISVATIRSHLSALFRKTNTRSQAELLIIARAVHG